MLMKYWHRTYGVHKNLSLNAEGKVIEQATPDFKNQGLAFLSLSFFFFIFFFEIVLSIWEVWRAQG